MSEGEIELQQTIEQAIHDLAYNTSIGDILGVVSRAYHSQHWQESPFENLSSNFYNLIYVEQHPEAIDRDTSVIQKDARILMLYTNTVQEGIRRIGYLLEKSPLQTVLYLDNGKQDSLYDHFKVSLGLPE